MAGDSGESFIITKDVERMFAFPLAQVNSKGGSWASASCWSPIPEGWPLGANIKGARSYGMCYRRHHCGVSEGSWNKIHSKRSWTYTMARNTGLLRKPAFGFNHTENSEDIFLLPFRVCPPTAVAERDLEEGREGAKSTSSSFTPQVLGPDHTCLGMMRLVGMRFHRAWLKVTIGENAKLFHIYILKILTMPLHTERHTQ